MVTDLEAERRAADARLGVAEELGWLLAFLIAWVVQIKNDSLLLSVVTFFAVVWLVGWVYGRESRAAWATVDSEDLSRTN